MCGICGVFDLTGNNRAEAASVRAMCDRIVHRGRDGDGYYDAPNIGLGMRRLSIIDIAGSFQPLYNEDRSLAMVMNGEIYNYRQLRAELEAMGHVFNTAGDGETILHLYESYGLDLFAHLRGMYAFALWDANQARLVLAVDHIGMKPLYTAQRDGMLYFASEAKALFVDGAITPALNLDTVDTFLSFGYPLGAETLFEGVQRVPAGHAIVAENGEMRTIQHWTFPAPTGNLRGDDAPDEDAIISETRRLLAESVQLHLESDVPVGLFLSGGIDSAALLALMSQSAQKPVQTFSVGYATDTPDNELVHARRVAEHFKTKHHELIITADDWWEEFSRYIYHHDEPNANPSAVTLQRLSIMASQSVKVVLTGLGGDELFGGYWHHRAIPWLIGAHGQWGERAKLAQTLGALERHYPRFKQYRVIGALPSYLPRYRQALLPLSDGLRRMQSFDGMVMSDALRDQLYGDTLRTAWTTAQHKERTYDAILAKSTRENAFDTAQALVINTWLTGNALLSQDKTGMAYSLEARVPFFDPALLAYAAEIPPALRMQSNKYVLRQAVRDDLPAFALERPKQPFGTPIINWFGHELAERIQALLLDPNAHVRALFDRAGYEQVIAAHFSGRANQVEVIFRLVTLELWMRQFLAR